MSYIDQFLAAVEPIFGGWLMVALAVSFVFTVYGLVWLVLEYRQTAALSKEIRKNHEEIAAAERERIKLDALSRIMASTERYRNLN